MAYYVDSVVNYGAAITTIAQGVPDHVTNDILLAYCVINTNTTPTAAANAGTTWAAWTAETTNATNAGYWTWLRADGTNNKTLTLTTADDYTCTVFCLRDVDATTAIDVSSQSGGAATAVPTNASVTTTTADCLVLYLMSVGGVANAIHSNPGIHHINSYDVGGTTDITTTCQGAGWYIQRTAGATPAPGWTCSVSGVYTRATIAFKNKASGLIPAYIDDTTSPATMLIGGHHTAAVTGIGVTFTGSLTMTGNMTNGKTTSYVAVSTTVGADLGINPFSYALTKASATQAKTALTGYELGVGTRTFTDALIVGSVIAGTPKMGTFGVGSIAEGGAVIRIGTAASVWKAWQVAAKNAVPTLENRCVFAIQPDYATSQYGSAGSYTGASGTQLIQFLSNQPSFSSTVNWAEIYMANIHVVAGGDSVNPVDTDGMAQVGKSYRLPVIQKTGGYGLLSYVPVKIGGGDAVNFQIDAGSLQFPRRYDAAKKEVAFHADINKVGISYAGKSGDVVKHTNSVVTSPSTYYWSIHANATNAATWDFSGLVVVNATVTLRAIMTFDAMTFSQCPSITTGASTVTNSIISKCAEFTASSATFTGCTFTRSIGTNGAISITGATEAAIQTELNKLASNIFSLNTTPLGALRIIYTGASSAIALSMSSNTFSGNTADIRWEAPTSSNLTINKTGTANPTTYSATNSNTVTFNQSNSFAVTNVVYNSEVGIFNNADSVAIATVENIGVSSPTGGSVSGPDANGRYTLTITHGYTSNAVFVVANCITDLSATPNRYNFLRQDYTVTNSTQSLPIVQSIDRNYLNP